MGKMYLNLIHRADGGPHSREALAFQLDAAHQLGLKVTTLISYQGFLDTEMLQHLREQRDLHGDELGIHLHELMCDDFQVRFASQEPAFYLHTREKKTAILEFLFARFEQEFGAAPTALGSYICDAWTLRHLKKKHPSIQAAISNCFEEGVKMFHGNNHNWCLFSDGGPWGPFHPALDNALCPASDSDDDIGIVALPHLNRDMIHALTGRDDLMSSHPINLLRGKINEGDQCPYWFRFTDAWIDQVRLNGWSYYSFFVSSPWLMDSSLFIDDVQEARSLYVQSLEYLATKRDEGRVQDMTMREFAAQFRQLAKPGDPQACHWSDVLTASRRQMFWFANAHYRIAADLVAGGAICDVRPYCGRISGDLGPDTPGRWNGNYPFLMSAELRGGHWRNHFACVVRIGKDARSIMDYRLGSTTTREADTWVLRVNPVEMQIGEHKVTLCSALRFDKTGCITIERTILESTADQVVIREEFCGSWGTTEYPEEMRGIVLQAFDLSGRLDENILTYQGITKRLASPRSVSARIPQVNCEIVLSSESADTAETFTGVLFNPGYTIALEKSLPRGASWKCSLVLQSLKPRSAHV